MAWSSSCKEPTHYEPHSFKLSPDDSLIVDTVTYEMLLKQIEPEDFWTGDNLRRLNQESLIDYLFEGIYSGRYRAVDIISGKTLALGI